MSVFLAPNLSPIIGGTYFPPEDRHGYPGFKNVLLGISKEVERESFDRCTFDRKRIDVDLTAPHRTVHFISFGLFVAVARE